MSWRVIVAIGLAFVVGAGAGALVEHQRVKDDKTAAAPTTTTTVPTADWFGSNRASACPALKRWQASAVAGYTAIARSKQWTTTRTEVAKQVSAGSAAYRDMITLANPTGKPELQYLLSHQDQLSTAAKNSTSLQEYETAQAAQTPARVKTDLTVVSQAVKGCS
jgi:hypothetical protein